MAGPAIEGAMGGLAASIFVATPSAPGSAASSLDSVIPATRGRVRKIPWALAHSWTDDDGTGSDFRAGYAGWVQSNVGRFNEAEYLCNWFPIRALVLYAAAKGLRVRLRRWPGSNSTSPTAKRHWNTSIVKVIDSHDGSHSSMERFYFSAKSAVTARMIGVLNSEAVERAELRVGDVLISDEGDDYWHAAMVVRFEGERFVVQSGYTPKKVPATRERSYTDFSDPDLYEQRARRWNYSFFDAPP